MEIVKKRHLTVRQDNTNVTSATLDHEVIKNNKDCDTKTEVKLEPEVLGIQIGQIVDREKMPPNCYRWDTINLNGNIYFSHFFKISYFV